MDRRDFIKRIFKWFMLIFLAFLAAVLGKKTTINKVCESCPEYSSCPGIHSCAILSSR